MKDKDNSRKWMWWFLGAMVALQLYFVRELLAAFALFALGFAAIVLVAASLYLLQQGWEAGVAHVAESENPVILAGRRGVLAIEEMGRRAFRRPGSEAVR